MYGPFHVIYDCGASEDCGAHRIAEHRGLRSAECGLRRTECSVIAAKLLIDCGMNAAKP